MMIKELSVKDLSTYTHFFQTLSNLSPSPEMSVAEATKVLQEINSKDGHIFVAIQDGRIICSVTLLIERKFIRGGALCGHIEDVVTHKDEEKKGIASSVIAHVLRYADERACYKVVLYCKTDLVPFYGKAQFLSKGVNMEVRNEHHLNKEKIR